MHSLGHPSTRFKGTKILKTPEPRNERLLHLEIKVRLGDLRSAVPPELLRDFGATFFNTTASTSTTFTVLTTRLTKLAGARIIQDSITNERVGPTRDGDDHAHRG